MHCDADAAVGIASCPNWRHHQSPFSNHRLASVSTVLGNSLAFEASVRADERDGSVQRSKRTGCVCADPIRRRSRNDKIDRRTHSPGQISYRSGHELEPIGAIRATRFECVERLGMQAIGGIERLIAPHPRNQT